MGDWLEAYASIMELDIWNATTCKRAAFDDATKRWTVEVEREGQTIKLTPSQLVLATAGYYIDVGASDLIIEGHITLKSGVPISRLTEDAVVMTDGTNLPADLIVYATGYGPMNDWAAQLISPAVADKVGLCWGLGFDTAKDPGPGKANCATCGSRRSRKRSGSRAAICSRRGIFRFTRRCRSRRGWRGFRFPSIARTEAAWLSRPARNSPLRPRH